MKTIASVSLLLAMVSTGSAGSMAWNQFKTAKAKPGCIVAQSEIKPKLNIIKPISEKKGK